ncbi:MAG: metallophosphoesterase [Armatimonadota bacterium]
MGRFKIFLRITLACFVALVLYSTLIEPRTLVLTRHEIAIPGLPKEFDGLNVVQITDIHSGLFIRKRHIEAVVRRVNRERPDVVVLTGDCVSRFPSGAKPMGESLSGLRAKHGLYAVLGNHDYWVDAPAVSSALRDAGFDLLLNESRDLGGLSIVGLDDYWEGDMEYGKAFTGIPPGAPCLVLAHNPETATKLSGYPVSLLLSGHTHGGMINLPLYGPLFTVTNLGPKYSSGMFKIGGVPTYICRGIGSGLPIRFRARPEIAVFTLKAR